jgi:hypothetical protein
VTFEYSATRRANKDEKNYDNISKLKSYQQAYYHINKAYGYYGTLYKLVYKVRQVRSKEGGNRRRKYFLEKSRIESLDTIGFDWTIKYQKRSNRNNNGDEDDEENEDDEDKDDGDEEDKDDETYFV